jgi:sugar transport protein
VLQPHALNLILRRAAGSRHSGHPALGGVSVTESRGRVRRSFGMRRAQPNSSTENASRRASGLAYVPESPRWLVTHGYAREAEATVLAIEQRVAQRAGRPLQPPEGGLEIHPRKSFGFELIFRAIFGRYRGRSVLALALMIAQSFLFNAVFFSYGLVLTRFHNVPESRAGIYLVPLATSNFLGPLLLGPLFDIIGRRCGDQEHTRHRIGSRDHGPACRQAIAVPARFW